MPRELPNMGIKQWFEHDAICETEKYEAECATSRRVQHEGQCVVRGASGACGDGRCVWRQAVRAATGGAWRRAVRAATDGCVWCMVTGVRGQPRARARGESHRPRPSKARGRGGQGKAHWSPANSSFRCNLSHKHALADGQKGTKAAAGARHGGVCHACKTRAGMGPRGWECTW